MGKWKSLYMYYISGTGNAEAYSFWIAEEAGKFILNGLANICYFCELINRDGELRRKGEIVRPGEMVSQSGINSVANAA